MVAAKYKHKAAEYRANAKAKKARIKARRERARAKYRARRDAGLCIDCDAPSPEYQRCDECRPIATMDKRQRVARRILAQLCVDCPNESKTHNLCKECRAKNYAARRKKYLASLEPCTDCGKELRRRKLRCVRCAQIFNNKSRIRRAGTK